MLEGAEHDVRDLVTGVGPDVDDLVVALAVRDDAFAILLFDRLDLFVRAVQLRLLLFRDDHVRDPDRNTGLRRPGKPELLQLVERLDRALLTRDLVATPDDIGELLLARRLVEEAHVLRPDVIENDAA